MDNDSEHQGRVPPDVVAALEQDLCDKRGQVEPECARVCSGASLKLMRINLGDGTDEESWFQQRSQSPPHGNVGMISSVHLSFRTVFAAPLQVLEEEILVLFQSRLRFMIQNVCWDWSSPGRPVDSPRH